MSIYDEFRSKRLPQSIRFRDTCLCADPNFLAHRAEQLLLRDDRADIKTLLEETVSNQQFIDYAFVQHDGHTYASTFKGRVPRNLFVLHKPLPGSPTVADFQNHRGNRYYDVIASVPETDAILHVGLSGDAIDTLANEHLWTIGIIGSAVFLLGLLMALKASASITGEAVRISKSLEKSESRKQAILDASLDMILQIDRNMKVEWANNAAIELAGRDVAGRKCHRALLGKDTACIDCPCQKAMLSEKMERATIRHPATSTSGETFWDIYGIPMHDESGNVIGVVDIARDVTVQKRAEDELQEYATALESTNIVLEELYEKANIATQAKSEFLANMSHEIRTPMTAILGFTDILIDENGIDNAPPQRVEALETIKRNGKFLLALINDILDLSKIEAGKLQVNVVACNPIEVIDDVVSLMRARADAKGISLDIEYSRVMPSTIQCDPSRLRQILVNLLGNAIKFTDSGSVRLNSRLVLGVNGPSALQFDVVDTGIGISPENAQNLFTPFSQADPSVAKNYGGTGLGLVISRRLAEMLGGDVTFSSRPGKGSTFTLTVETGSLVGVQMLGNPAGEEPTVECPIAPTDRKETDAGPPETLAQDSGLAKVETTKNRPARGAEHVAADNPSQKCELALNGRVLLAEDGPDNRRLIEFFLKQAGADVTAVENGSDACDAVQAAIEENKPFDVVLMDMQMPVKDGYEATRELRETGYDAPIIALTAFAMEGDRQKCIDAGCDEYLAKPIKRDDLLSTVHRYSSAGRHSPTPVGNK